MIVGAAQLNGRDGDNEPIAMMTKVVRNALAQGHPPIDEVRVVRGVWPYTDPGRLVADRLGVISRTGLTQLSGNEAFDVLNQSALEIAAGTLDAVVLCSAETMRTRRRDKKAGRRSPYLEERSGASPDRSFGSDIQIWEDADDEAWGVNAVNFYAMAASAVRHQRQLTPEHYLRETAALWSTASAVAAENPSAWIQELHGPSDIASPSPTNRLVADPFPKLMTSNINVDQAAAVVMCSVGTARAAGIDPGSWIFPLAGSGGYDPFLARTRSSFAESPSMRIAGRHALNLAQTSLEEVELIDLYSCFPSAVQVAQDELGISTDRPFTITGGMTFAGGPFNSYCMLSLVRAVELLREDPGTAFLTGNGGWFTKHSFHVLASHEPSIGFRYERPQAKIDATPRRETMPSAPSDAQVDAYTVTYDRHGMAQRAILAVADRAGARAWATSEDSHFMSALIAEDLVGSMVNLTGDLPVLNASL